MNHQVYSVQLRMVTYRTYSSKQKIRKFRPSKNNPLYGVSVSIHVYTHPHTQDSVCILLLQLSSLLVEHAAPHIHDSNNKRQGAKLRRLMTFAWPCLLPKQCVDPATKYHGHLLLAHIIAKFAIHKRIVLQVFHRWGRCKCTLHIE